MDYLASIFVPTGNRRLNELIGFLMCVSALLLFLALASYSPLDPSWNSASVLTGSHAARNWIGVVGAFTADMLLQFFGIGAFLLVIFPVDARRALVPLDESAVSAGQEPGRNLAGDVRPRAAGAAARTMRWMHVIPDRRPARPRGRRLPDSLLESGRRIHRLRHRAGGRAVSLDGVLVLGDSALGSDAVRLRHRAVESLQGLEAGARQETPAEGTGAAADFEADREDATDPVAARVKRTSASRTAPHRH